MNQIATLDAYGVLTEPATLKIERLLPGPVERAGKAPAPFWDGWSRLMKDYDRRMPA